MKKIHVASLGPVSNFIQSWSDLGPVFSTIPLFLQNFTLKAIAHWVRIFRPKFSHVEK